MMERKRVYLFITLLVGIVLGYASFRFFIHRAPSFLRLDTHLWRFDPRFHLDRETSRLEFVRDGNRTRIPVISSNEIHPLFLRNEATLPIDWRFQGNSGFFSHIYFESLNKPGKIRFALIRQRGRERKCLEYVETEKADFSLMKQLDLRKGDRLYFHFQGYGLAYVSRPVQYRLQAPKKQKLVILIGVDTLRADCIGRTVNGRPLTPHIDRFAAENVRFSRAYAQSSWTIPSFASLFSGLYGDHHQVTIQNPLSLKKPHLVKPLTEKFLTFGIHGGLGLDGRWGFARNFDDYQELPQTGPLYPRGGESLFQKAMEMIRAGRFPSLFLFLHTYQVHAPYTPPKEYLSAIAGPGFPESRLDVVNSGKPELTYLPVDGQKREALQTLYFAEVHAFDDFFGRFLAELKTTGLYDRAMIVFLGDHGEEFFEHGGWAHSHSLYEELIHVPLIVKFPGGEFSGRTISGLSGLIDILPTILDYWEIPPDANMKIDGVSLMPALRENQDARSLLISSNSYCRYIDAIPPRFALLRGMEKCIFNFPFSPADIDFFPSDAKPPAVLETELFALDGDPAERINLAASDTGRLNAWKSLLLEWQKKVGKAMQRKARQDDEQTEESRRKLKSLGYI